MMSAVNAIAFPVPPRTWSASVLRRRPDLVILHTASGETTAAVKRGQSIIDFKVHVRNKRRVGTRPVTVLYSHANAEDLGLSLPFLDVLSKYCGCDVLAYEYSGYSISSGEATEANCLECIDAALSYLTEECLVPAQRVVAYGRSIGSGPTVDLASRNPKLGGVILQSAIASAGLVVLPSSICRALRGYDLFRNYEKMSRVECRTLMIHGKDDKMVPFDHAMMLFPLVKDKHPPLWIAGAGHHDMPDDLCLNAVANFVNFVEERANRLAARDAARLEKSKNGRSLSGSLRSSSSYYYRATTTTTTATGLFFHSFGLGSSRGGAAKNDDDDDDDDDASKTTTSSSGLSTTATLPNDDTRRQQSHRLSYSSRSAPPSSASAAWSDADDDARGSWFFGLFGGGSSTTSSSASGTLAASPSQD